MEIKYYTKFSLEWTGEFPAMNQVTGKLTEMRDGLSPGDPGFENAGKNWDLILTGVMDTHWPDAESDVAEISRQWPDSVFTLDGEGEERQGNWRTYFQNGMRDARTGEGPHFLDFEPARLQ